MAIVGEMRGRRSSTWLAVLLGAGLLAPTGAAAGEAPSVDAYGGQAKIFGKPHHRHLTSQGASNGTRAASPSTAGAGHSGGSGPGSSGPSGSAPSVYTAPGGAGAPAGSHPAATGGASSSNGGGSTGGSGARSSGTAGGGAMAPVLSSARPARSTVPLGGLEVALIVIGAVALLASAVVLRRLAHPGAQRG